MIYLKHSRGTALPRTYVGRWLRAAMLDQQEERDRLVRTLNGGTAVGWNDDEPAVVEVAISLVLQRYFGPDSDPKALGELIEVVSAALEADNRLFDVPKAEAVIHAALGDYARSADGLSRLDRFRLRAVVIGLASMKLGLSDADADGLLREAERLAFEGGFHPPLVRHGLSAGEP